MCIHVCVYMRMCTCLHTCDRWPAGELFGGIDTGKVLPVFIAYVPMWLPVPCIAQARMRCEHKMPDETAVKASGQNMTQAAIMKHSPQIVPQVTADKVGFAHQEKEATSYATVCNIHPTCSDYRCTQTGP